MSAPQYSRQQGDSIRGLGGRRLKIL